MLFLLKKLLPFFVSLAFLFILIYFIEPPKTWTEASLFQILVFFIPLLLTFTFFINIFISFLPWSFITSLGLMLVVVFFVINLLNIVTILIVVVLTFISLKLFPKFNYPRKLRMNPFKKRLTSNENIPKLTRIGNKNE
jgi:hypothetical protein